MLFTDFHKVTHPEATIAAIENYAATRGISWDSIEHERNAANPRVWAPIACRALNLRGGCSDAIRRAYGVAIVELCLTAVALVSCLIGHAPDADMYRIEQRVNARILEVAV